jgi:hypothetical protein
MHSVVVVVVVGKPEWKRPLGRPRHRWEDNIIMDLKGSPCGDRGIRIVPPLPMRVVRGD